MTSERENSQRKPTRGDGGASWSLVRQVPALDAASVHVWMAELAALEPWSARLYGVLDRTERERAGRFRFERDCVRFGLSHGWVRLLLGQYLRRDPSRVRLGVSALGKPFVQEDAPEPPLQFSLSHSGELAVLAVARGRPVGADVEAILPERATPEIAARFFSPEEAQGLGRLPQERRAEAFFRCWTRKEAYVKARGDGLSRRLDRFSVSLGAEATPSLRPCGAGEEEAAGWSLRDLAPPAGYAGAVAAEGAGWPLRRLRPSPELLSSA